jgi:acyl-CoA reductase-like NAD-dependent aldehyde dehydrogenase
MDGPGTIGMVAAISTFNHPLNIIVHQIAPALARPSGHS